MLTNFESVYLEPTYHSTGQCGDPPNDHCEGPPTLPATRTPHEEGPGVVIKRTLVE